ncbi:hypothetical protein XELAEV_18019801mg [Xenopus laevis]|uniref:Uncharacterized protein n=1 Tax=Xenopus laevis TaxID=8355 RepID=A0A974D6H6_XENLA|nr:hypothetical protein XELAEV_18019801mg [Xenopus laevis]
MADPLAKMKSDWLLVPTRARNQQSLLAEWFSVFGDSSFYFDLDLDFIFLISWDFLVSTPRFFSGVSRSSSFRVQGLYYGTMWDLFFKPLTLSFPSTGGPLAWI